MVSVNAQALSLWIFAFVLLLQQWLGSDAPFLPIKPETETDRGREGGGGGLYLTGRREGVPSWERFAPPHQTPGIPPSWRIAEDPELCFFFFLCADTFAHHGLKMMVASLPVVVLCTLSVLGGVSAASHREYRTFSAARTCQRRDGAPTPGPAAPCADPRDSCAPLWLRLPEVTGTVTAAAVAAGHLGRMGSGYCASGAWISFSQLAEQDGLDARWRSSEPVRLCSGTAARASYVSVWWGGVCWRTESAEWPQLWCSGTPLWTQHTLSESLSAPVCSCASPPSSLTAAFRSSLRLTSWKPNSQMSLLLMISTDNLNLNHLF